MGISMVTFWIIATIILIVVESLTMGLTTIWFAFGTAAATIVALLGGSLPIQILSFVVVSAIMLVFTRKIVVEKLKTGKEDTNIDTIIGKIGVVRREIKSYEPGTVYVWGQEWSAISQNPGEVISIGKEVKILRIDGVKLIVEDNEKLEKEN